MIEIPSLEIVGRGSGIQSPSSTRRFHQKAIFAVGMTAALGLLLMAAPDLMTYFGVSQSTADMVTGIVLYSSWEVAFVAPWLLPELGVFEGILWWVGYAGSVNW